MRNLRQLIEKESRVVAGLMSGTSLDGVDAVIARLTGSGRSMQFEQLAFVSVPYPDKLRSLLLCNSAPEGSSVRDLSQLNVRLAQVYAEAVTKAAAEAGLQVADLDLVGSHGQTVHHVPDPSECAGADVISTLQIGDPSVLANLLDVPVVGDFRVADMALGGQGAPLVPYFDYVGFTDENETRGLLNIGGIANISVLPAGLESPDGVFAFDTGPGNMLSDTLTKRYYRTPYDAGGAHAAAGRFDEAVLADLLSHPYFTHPPPKSTGRELFDDAFADRVATRVIEARQDAGADDVIATAAMLTVLSVYQAYARFIRDRHTLDVLIVSGGGMHNDFVMDRLAQTFAPIQVRTVDEYGVSSDAKEALCFAVLAHETINGVPTSLPSVTGARRATLLGKICVP